MKVPPISFLITSVFFLASPFTPSARAAGGGFQPAMIGGGPDSVASKLHYPPKEKAANNQGVVAFQCEVRPDGDVSQIDIRCDRKHSRFGDAVNVALRGGRFQPARVGGKAVTAMIGGTVLFTIEGGRPTVAISLVTAEKEKIIARHNYIQPQLIDGPEFRRKIFKFSYEYRLRGAKDPGAEVAAQVDAQGNLTGTKILAESPAQGNWGPLLVKGLEGQKFIPAMKNGQFVAGEFNIILNARNFRDPDAGPRVGTLLKDPETR